MLRTMLERAKAQRESSAGPVAPKITVKSVEAALKLVRWHLDRSNQAYELRSASVLGGAVSFTQIRHTSKRAEPKFYAIAYTGVEGRRWDMSPWSDALRDAVAWANERAQRAVDATAAELGPDFMEVD